MPHASEEIIKKERCTHLESLLVQNLLAHLVGENLRADVVLLLKHEPNLLKNELRLLALLHLSESLDLNEERDERIAKQRRARVLQAGRYLNFLQNFSSLCNLAFLLTDAGENPCEASPLNLNKNLKRPLATELTQLKKREHLSVCNGTQRLQKVHLDFLVGDVIQVAHRLADKLLNHLSRPVSCPCDNIERKLIQCASGLFASQGLAALDSTDSNPSLRTPTAQWQQQLYLLKQRLLPGGMSA